MSQNEIVTIHSKKSGGSIMDNIKVLGIDLAKNVFQLHGTDEYGKGIFRKLLSREKLVEFMANLSPCLIGIEACALCVFCRLAYDDEFEKKCLGRVDN
ncbi:transposase [Legionella israelensis]|nr:transposase [Legionella israelensis]